MSTYTQNLNLFKYDVVADHKAPYNIIEYLNNNWDKLDIAYGDLTTSLNAHNFNLTGFNLRGGFE